LAEAESELVSGFMTEHAAVIFVFFFLAEYASIILICILTSILFLGGYIIDFAYILHLVNLIEDSIFYIIGYIFNLIDMLKNNAHVIYYVILYLCEMLFPSSVLTYNNFLNEISSSDSVFKNFFDFYFIFCSNFFDYNAVNNEIGSEPIITNTTYKTTTYNSLTEGTLYGLTLGLKSCIMIFVFI
jgi:hypothetical protein